MGAALASDLVGFLSTQPAQAKFSLLKPGEATVLSLHLIFFLVLERTVVH